MPRGIKHCYWKTNNGQLYTVEKGKTYYLYANDVNEFIVDETCMEEDTVNKKSSANAARWAFIYNGFFSDVEKIDSGSTPLWGKLGTGAEPIKKWGIGTNYKVGGSLKFAPSGYNYYFGYKQRVELFSYTPGSGFYFYVVPIAKSSIGFVYFDESERVRRYGDLMTLHFLFHGYNLEKDHTYKTKVYLLEEEKAVGLGETSDFQANNLWKEPKFFDIKGRLAENDYNCRFSCDFMIDIDWKKGENRQKNFTVAVEIYRPRVGKDGKEDSKNLERVAYRNFATEPTKDLFQYDQSLLKIEDIDNKQSISSRFMVSEELMDHYLKRVQQVKTNQIQYIGDIRYTRKEFDPCGYSTITVKSDDLNVVIFDENDTKAPIDRTAQTIDIIAGDKRKNISIKVGNLTTKNVPCQGVLLEAGQKHSDQKNLFQMDKVMPALRLLNNIYVTSPNPNQKGDTNVSPDTKKGYSQDVSDTQEWVLNRDYKFNGEDEAILMLGYVYNKTFAEKMQTASLGKTNAAVDTLWLFNYFFLGDDNAQTYYLPISTCRYPNQIAQIRIFPDIEWEIAFMITIGRGYTGKVRYERERMSNYHQGFGFKYLKDDLHIDATQTSNLGWSLKGKCVENGTEHTLGLDSVKKTIDTAVAAFDMVHVGLQRLNPQDANGASAAVSKRVIELDFSIDPPNIGFALGWKFGSASTQQLVPIYTGGFRADPLIGLTISVDLVPLVAKFNLLGKILNWIISAIEYLTDSDIYITFEVAQAVKINLSLSYNKIDGFDKKNQQKIEYEAGITIKAGCKSNDVVMIPTVTRAGVTETTEMEKWKVEGSVGTSFTFTEEVGYDTSNGKQFKQSSVTWNPAKITITCYELLVSKVTFQPNHSETFKLFDEIKLYQSAKEYIDEK